MIDAVRNREHLAARLAAVEAERDMLLRLIDLYDQWLALPRPIDTPEREGLGVLGSPAPATDAPGDGREPDEASNGEGGGTVADAPSASATPSPASSIEAPPQGSERKPSPAPATTSVRVSPAGRSKMSAAAIEAVATRRAAGPYPCPHCPRTFPLPQNIARHLKAKHPDGAMEPAPATTARDHEQFAPSVDVVVEVDPPAPPPAPWSPEPVVPADVKVEIRRGKEWFLCTRCPTKYPTRAKLAHHLTHDHEPEPEGARPVGRAPQTYNGGGIPVSGLKLG